MRIPIYNGLWPRRSRRSRPGFAGMRKVRTAGLKGPLGTVLDNVKAEQSRFIGTKPTESATEKIPPGEGIRNLRFEIWDCIWFQISNFKSQIPSLGKGEMVR
jgi:hypothetical protein